MTITAILTVILSLVTAYLVGFVAGETYNQNRHDFMEDCYADDSTETAVDD